METANNQVIIKRTFQANISRVWKAFTTVEDMLKWQSPVGMITPAVESDFRVGGAYAITMEYMETNVCVTVRGNYTEIQEPTRLVYTWKWDGQTEETTVAMDFAALSPEETEITLTHSGFSEHPTPEDVANSRTRADHNNGWTTALQKLEQLVITPLSSE